jgi:Tfp pilus assembly protein PilN
MHTELTNLLPFKRRRALMHDYVFRLGVVGLLFVSVLVGAAGILLVPTYVLLAGDVSAKEASLAHMTSTLSSADSKTLSAHLAALSNESMTLLTLAQTPSVSTVVRAVLALPRPGITLSGFAYTLGTGNTPGTLALSGTATTRDALRGYQLTLQKTSFASSADLPVSAYAHDANIAFTITVTLMP